MADEHIDSRPINFRQWFPWLEIFRGFQVALDPKKLLLAAIGLLAVAGWWWLWSVIFYSSWSKPKPLEYDEAAYRPSDTDVLPPGKTAEAIGKERAWEAFQKDRRKWNLIHEAAGDLDTQALSDAGDLATNYDEVRLLNKSEAYNQAQNEAEAALKRGDFSRLPVRFTLGETSYAIKLKPYGRIRTPPWFEDRGPNQFLLLTGKTQPWPENHFPSWFVANQVPVLIEPLVKFMRPVFYFLHPEVGFWNFIYLTIILVGTLAIWAVFGGMITRMAAVQIARRERIGVRDAWRFTVGRWWHFFTSPLIPLGIIVVLVLLTIVFGFLHLIPLVGDIVIDGVFWFLIVIAGLFMTAVLIGLVGWPMMYATISAEGSDNFDALSRSYSYVYQNPWSYAWYALLAVSYGMIVVFFIGLFGSFTVYLGKWGVSQTPLVNYFNRNPDYLFMYAPTTYGWRDLLMQDSKAWQDGAVREDLLKQHYTDNPDMHWWNRVGAFMVAVWLGLVLLLIVGFGYCYFWSASTIIYLLMRRKVDDTELDEVWLEEEEPENPFTEPPPEEKAEVPPEPVPQPEPVPAAPAVTMVEPPTLKPPAPVAESPAAAPVEAVPAPVPPPASAAAPLAAPAPTTPPASQADGNPSPNSPNP